MLGCGSPAPVEETTGPRPLRLGDSIEVSLEGLLTKPRPELAELADQWLTKIEYQERALKEGRLQYYLLPKLRFPLVVPVWQNAKYSAQLGFSVPSYASDHKDSALAFHLAHYGDSAAAKKFAEPADVVAISQVQASAAEHAYPLEWTRLTALLFHAAEIRLAIGEAEGATELVLLHQQLRHVLDPKASKGDLGAALLPLGYEALTHARSAWRNEKQNEIADQIDAALKDWGDRPARVQPAWLGKSRVEIGRLLAAQPNGRTLVLAPAARAFDLLDLPFPAEKAESYFAFFNDSDKVSEAWVVYSEAARATFREPAQLSYRLTGALSSAALESPDFALPGIKYAATGVEYDVAYPPPGAGVGAMVRLLPASKGNTSFVLSRDFGIVNLDRSFDENRARLLPDVQKDVLTVKQPKELAQLTNPIAELKPDEFVVRKEPKYDVVASLTMMYPLVNESVPPLQRFLTGVCALAGAPAVGHAQEDEASSLAFEWHDPNTRYTIRLPLSGGSAPVVFRAADIQGTELQSARERAAIASDHHARAERFRTGKPRTRLPRSLDRVALGMTRAEVEQLLPAGKMALRQTIPDGLSVTFLGNSTDSEPFVVRQVWIRFDESGRVVEIRCRYDDGDGQPAGDWPTEMFKVFRAQGGTPLQSPPPCLRALANLPPQKPAPVFFSWHDDTSLLSYERDSGGVELGLRDCPPDHEGGVPLPPFEYLPRGAEGCNLGLPHDDLLKKWHIDKPVVLADGALVLRPAATSPYDALLVWSAHGHVDRIVARHRPDGVKRSSASDWADALTHMWRREAGTLGWPRRQDLSKGDLLQGLTWYDDQTRVRTFWQQGDDSVQIFTEWKDLSGK
jgi:hypothetical protein